MPDSLPAASGVARRIAMCEPTHFGVEYVINPWMEGHVGRVSSATARRQWQGLHELLRPHAEIVLQPAVTGLPDQCFTANAGLVLGDVFVPSVFRVSQRAPEAPHAKAFAADQGFRIVELPEDQPFEGEGDALFQPDEPLLWAGYGVRSSLESHRTLSEVLDVEVVSLRLVDERFYHLDTCFTPLPGGRLFYYPAAFDDPSRRAIEARIPADRRLAVSEDDALRFACNAVRVGSLLVSNHASDDLRRRLGDWGFELQTTPLDEFMLAGGAAKCLCLLLRQDVPDGPRNRAASAIREAQLTIEGHLLDTTRLNRALDLVTDAGGSFRVERFEIGERRDQPSVARLRVSAPTAERLDLIVSSLLPLGVRSAGSELEARLEPAPKQGVAPPDFYATTIYATDVRIRGDWRRVEAQRMDAVIAVDPDADPPRARSALIRDLAAGEAVVCGTDGVRVRVPAVARREGREEDFSFMSAAVSTERRVELVVEELAWEMQRIRARGGRIVVVAGPVVIHTGGSHHLAALVRAGYVQALLTGNALPVHDIELALYGTSLGIDLARGVGVHEGHQHHLKAINRIRAAGSIRAAVQQGILRSGVVYECVRAGVPYVLAGSIRDDGPLPDTEMDLLAAQAGYARAIEGADMIVMLSSMLHAIGVGNMTPAGVRLVCVDISPSVVTKLVDRGSVESIGVVTDVGLFLNLLARRLCKEEA